MRIEDQIREDRGTQYGPFRQHWEATGRAWFGLLTQMGWRPPEGSTHILPRNVGLFFAADKLMREAHAHKADNVHDCVNYVRMAGEAAEDLAPCEYRWTGENPASKTITECGCRVKSSVSGNRS